MSQQPNVLNSICGEEMDMTNQKNVDDDFEVYSNISFDK